METMLQVDSVPYPNSFFAALAALAALAYTPIVSRRHLANPITSSTGGTASSSA